MTPLERLSRREYGENQSRSKERSYNARAAFP